MFLWKQHLESVSKNEKYSAVQGLSQYYNPYCVQTYPIQCFLTSTIKCWYIACYYTPRGTHVENSDIMIKLQIDGVDSPDFCKTENKIGSFGSNIFKIQINLHDIEMNLHCAKFQTSELIITLFHFTCLQKQRKITTNYDFF